MHAPMNSWLAGWITDAENALRAVQNDQEFLNTVGYSIRTLQFNAGWYKMSISEIDDLISQIESELIKLEESP